MSELTTVNVKELIELAALDTRLYARTFFPNTFRQDFAPFHQDLFEVLEDRAHRHVSLAVFRGGAKTTCLRVLTSKRIAYGTSRTILFVSNSQDHAQKSVEWIKRQVDFNKTWAGVYNLSRGDKWTEDFIKIRHGVYDTFISLIAVGITGQVRGHNIEDYRPDLIVVDDPDNEETTGTPAQRQKTAELFFGALEKSLAPASEAPDAKMVLLQTPLHQEDLISTCLADPQWASRVYSAFTSTGESSWPARWTTAERLAEKQASIHRNQLSLWLREMECTIVSPESALFRPEWLKHWSVLPEDMAVFLAIDPVPPPSAREEQAGLTKKDFEVLVAVGVHGQDRYLLELSSNRGHTPEWTVSEFFRLVQKWQPLSVRVEATGYQRTLKWLLEQEMKKRGRFVTINAPADNRRKQTRIVQALSGLASQGRFYIHPSQVDFASQFCAYPNVPHDDLLDGTAMALTEADQFWTVFNGAGISALKTPFVDLPADWRGAP